MSFPDTMEQAAERALSRIEHGFRILDNPPRHFEEDAEQRAFRLAARDGASAYCRLMDRQIERCILTPLMLEKADLVGTAATCAGWISATGAVVGRGEALQELLTEGFLEFHPAVPGRFVACYRLQVPPE